MQIIFLLLTLTCFIYISQASISIASSVATLDWTVNENQVTFKLDIKRKGWFAIGFAKSMKNTDMVLVEIDDTGSAVLTDLWSTSESMPAADSKQSLVLLNQTVTANSVSVSFSRLLDTSDQQDMVLSIGNTYTWCYAYGSDLKMMSIHSKADSFAVQFNDQSGSSSTSPSSNGAIITHVFLVMLGILMV